MSKFYYFLNPSGNLRLTLKFLSSYQKWWMNGWVGGWVFWSSHTPSLGMSLKDEGKTGREGYPAGCSCSQWRADLAFAFLSMSSVSDSTLGNCQWSLGGLPAAAICRGRTALKDSLPHVPWKYLTYPRLQTYPIISLRWCVGFVCC